MIAINLQCPTCGRNLVHSEQLLSRLEGRRGTTRCPCCSDRIHFDATGPALRVTFPDLPANTGTESHSVISKETVSPPEVVEDRQSYIVTKDGTITVQEIPVGAFKARPLPARGLYDRMKIGRIHLESAVEEDVVLPLVQRKQVDVP